MSERLLVHLFVEDRAHEELLVPLVRRVAREEGRPVVVRPRSVRGGHARAIEEYALYQKLADRGIAGQEAPDLVVVGIDGKCTTFAKKRREILDATTPMFLERVVVACPDPHVESWYLADPDSFESVVGHRPSVGRRKCARDHYKALLAAATRQAGHPPTLGGVEFAREIAEALDLYRAGRNDHSLKAFVDELRAALRGAR